MTGQATAGEESRLTSWRMRLYASSDFEFQNSKSPTSPSFIGLPHFPHLPLPWICLRFLWVIYSQHVSDLTKKMGHQITWSRKRNSHLTLNLKFLLPGLFNVPKIFLGFSSFFLFWFFSLYHKKIIPNIYRLVLKYPWGSLGSVTDLKNNSHLPAPGIPQEYSSIQISLGDDRGYEQWNFFHHT